MEISRQSRRKLDKGPNKKIVRDCIEVGCIRHSWLYCLGHRDPELNWRGRKCQHILTDRDEFRKVFRRESHV